MTPHTQTVCLSCWQTDCPLFVHRFPWTRRAEYSAALCGVCCVVTLTLRLNAPVASGMTAVYVMSQESVSARRLSVSILLLLVAREILGPKATLKARTCRLQGMVLNIFGNVCINQPSCYISTKGRAVDCKFDHEHSLYNRSKKRNTFLAWCFQPWGLYWNCASYKPAHQIKCLSNFT